MKNIRFKGWPRPNPNKMTLKMKLTTLLLIVSLFKIQANSYSQNTKISLNHDEISIEDVFREIEDQSEFRFLYKNRELNVHTKVTIHVKKENIYGILDQLFVDLPIKYEVLDNRQIILTRQNDELIELQRSYPELEQQQKFVVNGTIVDSNGTPLAAANVLEKGTNNGVMADFDGNFTISVESDMAILTVSYLGFATKDIEVNGQAELKVVLE